MLILTAGMEIDMEKKYKITGACIGCKNCLRVCPAGAILTGPMKISEEKCIRCGKCYRACPGKKIIELS